MFGSEVELGEGRVSGVGCEEHLGAAVHVISSGNWYSGVSDLEHFQQVLRSGSSVKFNTNILKIALNYQEDKVAAYLLTKFPLLLQLATLDFAVANKQLAFLHNIFFYARTTIDLQTDDSADDESDNTTRQYTIEELLQKIASTFTPKEAEELLTKVLSWNFPASSNLLKLLCDLQHESVAARFMQHYTYESTWDFFYESLVEERNHFVKQALRYQFFDWNFMYGPRVIAWILERMKSGVNILFPLNLLLFTDYRKWEVEQLQYVSSLYSTGNSSKTRNSSSNATSTPTSCSSPPTPS